MTTTIIKKLIVLFAIFSIFSFKNKALTSKNNTLNVSAKDVIVYKNLADSLYLFSMKPIEFKEYYMEGDVSIENKAYMEKTLEHCNHDFIPYLIDKIIDTTYTDINFAGVSQLRVGDIALELIEISDKKFSIPHIIFNEFNDFDLVGLNKMREDRVYTVGNVYIHLFFKEPKFKHVNYKNRERVYLALKKQYSALEKKRK